MITAFLFGLVIGAAVMAWIEREQTELYRRWYLMVREELEKLDPRNEALRKIGASRTLQDRQDRRRG
jgi:hypothetical protein